MNPDYRQKRCTHGWVSQAETGGECSLCLNDAQKTREINVLVQENRKLLRVLEAAVNLVTAPSWAGVSDEDCELEKVLKDCGFVEDIIEEKK